VTRERAEHLDSLYREHAPALLRYLGHRFGRAAPAEDLLQDTFLQAVRGADRLEDFPSPRAWLFGIARHVGLTAVRRRRESEQIPPSVPAPSAVDTDPRVAVVREAIEGLSPPLRETLELRLRDDLSYEEIAGVLGIPVGTVRSRLHHAVRRLRDEVSKGGSAEGRVPKEHR
jgi:RNA polymerase sigma-70 factor (ECF subfamily)